MFTSCDTLTKYIQTVVVTQCTFTTIIILVTEHHRTKEYIASGGPSVGLQAPKGPIVIQMASYYGYNVECQWPPLLL